MEICTSIGQDSVALLRYKWSEPTLRHLWPMEYLPTAFMIYCTVLLHLSASSEPSTDSSSWGQSRCLLAYAILYTWYNLKAQSLITIFTKRHNFFSTDPTCINIFNIEGFFFCIVKRTTTNSRIDFTVAMMIVAIKLLLITTWALFISFILHLTQHRPYLRYM